MIPWLTLAKSRWVQGVVLCLGFLTAIGLHGALKYREGLTAGVTQERAATAQTNAIAKAISDSTWAALFAVNTSLRDSIRVGTASAARQAARLAAANARAGDAEAAYAAARQHDTASTPLALACDAVVQTCRAARQEAEAQRDSTTHVVALLETRAMTQDSILISEPMRQRIALQQGIAAFRATIRPPSRLPMFTSGLVVGVGLGLLSLVIHR